MHDAMTPIRLALQAANQNDSNCGCACVSSLPPVSFPVLPSRSIPSRFTIPEEVPPFNQNVEAASEQISQLLFMLCHPVSYKHCRFNDLIKKAETLYEPMLLMEKHYAAIYKCKVALEKAQAARAQEFERHQTIANEYPAVFKSL